MFFTTWQGSALNHATTAFLTCLYAGASGWGQCLLDGPSMLSLRKILAAWEFLAWSVPIG